MAQKIRSRQYSRLLEVFLSSKFGLRLIKQKKTLFIDGGNHSHVAVLAVISRSSTEENRHITDRVSLMLSKGDIRSIVDPRLGDMFNAGLAWKISEVALAYASQTSETRLTMSQVVFELKESLCRARTSGGSSEVTLRDPTKMMVSMIKDPGVVPHPK
ncbi:unnamed protein product [Arabis nemorensis]|uniref:Uncharacterized protein n=1 Tax=Arabis nemorensis TaxID=586526 RepID=A0A565BE59_9BRAS|nr:unnamed protein product [Arabis nemorensis]